MTTVQKKLHVFSSEGLLPTVKVILQWLLTDPALISWSMQACPGLWSGLLLLLNLMPTAQELQDDNLGLSPLLQQLLPYFEQPDSSISLPLPEDVILHCLLPFWATQERLDFQLDLPPPFSWDEVVLYACVLQTFGHLATRLPESLITFEASLGLFIQRTQEGKPLQTPEERVTQSCVQKKTWWNSSSKKKQKNHQQQQQKQQQKQQQLMLQKELELMERHLQQLKLQTALSPYLIIDCLALCQHLSLISQMAQSGSFITIIPRMVIDELDRRKEKSSARQALKLLEDGLKNRSRYLRCQVEVGQKLIKPMTKGVDAPAWNLYGILRTHGEGPALAGAEGEQGKGMVTALTALSLADPTAFSYPLKLAFWAADNAGVQIRHILTFYGEWKKYGEADFPLYFPRCYDFIQLKLILEFSMER